MPIICEDEWKGCYRPDLCYPILRLLKMTSLRKEMVKDELIHSSIMYACQLPQNESNDIRVFVTLYPTTPQPKRFKSISPRPTTELMEGSEAGMVAVVQGLQDAGLAVTLLSRRFAEPRARSILADVLGIQAPGREVPKEQVSQTPVEAETETAFGQSFPRDNGYSTSYQLAHCRPVGPTPNRQSQYSSPGFHHYRSSISRTHDEEIFVESLRKYPYISPNRSLSADLIERMLSYTQKRSGTRRSNTRNVKSLLYEEDTQLDEIPTRDNGISSNDSTRLHFGFKRDAELIPAPSSNKKSRHENDTGMYDYLKSNRKDRRLKGSDVRYLTTVKECLKERLRQMCDEGNPTICPKIQSRYNHHRRQHHSNKCAGCQDTITQASAPIQTQNVPGTSSEQPKGNRLSTFKHSKACFCDRSQDCDCASKQSRTILKSKSAPDELITEVCKHEKCMASALTQVEINDEYFLQNNLQEMVLDWALEIPVYANFNTEERLKREQVINELIDTLHNMQGNDQFLKSAEREIKKFLKILPMWRPESTDDQDIFVNKLTNSLLKRLRDLENNKSRFENEICKWVDNLPLKTYFVDKEKIVNDLKNNLESISQRRSSNDEQYKNDLKSEIVRMLNELPIETNCCRTMFINKLAEKLAENLIKIPLDQTSSSTQSDLQQLVLGWVKDIPQLSVDVHLKNDDYVLVNDLIQGLNNLMSSNIDASGDLISNYVTNWLNIIEEKKGCQIDSNTKKVLTDQLVDKLFHLNGCDIRLDNVNDIVNKWFQDNKQDLGIDLNQSELDKLTTKLQELQNIESNQNHQNIMRQEILNWLQNLQRKRGTHIDSVTQENLVNKLIGMVRGTLTENQLITQKIWEWLSSQQNIPRDLSPRYRGMVSELSEKLQNIMDEKGDLDESDIKAEVGAWIDMLSEKHGLKTNIQDRNNLEDQLLKCVKPLKKRKQWNKPESIEAIIKKEVDNIIDDVDIPLKAVDKARLKKQLIKVFTDNWNVSVQPEELLLEVEKILEEVTTLDKKEIKKLADKLLNTVKEATLPKYDKTVRSRITSLDKSSQDKLRRMVTNILQTSSLKNTPECMDTIIDALSKINSDKNESVYKLIYNILKNAQLNDNEAVDITNRLLNVAIELRGELSESEEDTTYKSLSFGSMESAWIQKQMFMQRLEKEITNFMEKVLTETSSFLREKTSDFITSLQTQTDLTATQFKRPLKTSTPKSGSEENVLSIEKETKSSMLSGRQVEIDVDKSKKENKYKDKIKEVIRKWLDSLELNGKIDKTLMDKIANDIATDIIDREKYIKLSKAKTSNQEEIEHLKYQIFKWTNKLPISNELDIKTSKIKLLIKSLQEAKVPYLKSEISDLEIRSEHKVDISFSDHHDTTLTRDTNEFIEEKIYSAILSWINQKSILMPRNSEEKRFIDDLVTELSQSLTNILILEAAKTESTMENLCIKEISKYLKKFEIIAQNNFSESIQNLAIDLMNHLKITQILAAAQKQMNSTEVDAKTQQKKYAIKQAVQNWCQKLSLKRGTTYEDIKATADKLAEAISRYLLVTDMEDIDSFMNEILNNLKQLPLQFDKEHYKTLPQFTETLIDTLKEVLNDSDKYNTQFMEESVTSQSVPKPAHKKAAALIFDNIQEWCENLPLEFDTTNEGFEEAHKIKQELGAKLMKKIGELNLDPELFHDDLYEDVLRDEIEKILDELPKTKNLEAVLPTLKENLIKNLLSAKEEMKTEIAGYAYKQQLREAISKTLSSIGLPVVDETPFEVLKDNLADAFISLHYVADDKELKKKFKEKIFNEVTKFCNDYLMRYPSSPLDANQLNRDLYTALKKVPMPKDESLRREVEHIRMKDVVTDWFKDLPLEEIMSQAQENKIISWLSKRLYEIEKETEFNPDLDKDNMMKNEIVKWLKKIKFQTKELDPETMTEQLISKLKATKDSRKLDETFMRKSINYADLTKEFEDIIPSIPQTKRPTITSEIVKSSNAKFPPSSLNAEDKAHLERIRQRTSMERPVVLPDNRKDASVSPVPVPAGVQTEEKQTTNNFVFQNISQNASIQTIIKEPEHQIPITPQVIVKEYYWDLSQSSPMDRSGSILSCTKSPVVEADGAKQQAVRTSPATSQLTTASQTLPSSSTAKATITQETTAKVDTQTTKATITQELVRGDLEKNPKIGTLTQTSCLRRQQQHQKEREIPPNTIDSHYNPKENLQIRGKGMPCKPCRGRVEVSQSTNNQEVGRSDMIEEENIPENDAQQPDVRCKHDCRMRRNLIENKYCWDQNEICHQPCFRRRLYETPIGSSEQNKRKKKNLCSCKSHTTKCTIRPLQESCEQAHKSCNALLKHCPKCWDGFCPHPSYLYFRRD